MRFRGNDPLAFAGNKTRAAPECQVLPCPVSHYANAVAEPDQKIDMDQSPGEPCQESLEMDDAKIADGRVAADRRQRSLVPVYEGATRFSFEIADHGLCRKRSHLDRRRCDAGNWKPVLAFDGREIAGNENVRVSGYAEIGLHLDAPGAIRWHSQHLA